MNWTKYKQLNLEKPKYNFKPFVVRDLVGNANKVSSAVRATHLKTGLFVLAMDSRSQHQNKKLALKRLEQKVMKYNTANLSEAVKNQWENHLQLERGNPVKVFKGRGFKLQ